MPKLSTTQRIIMATLLLPLCFAFVQNVNTATLPDHAFPRTANYFLKWEMTQSEARQLAEWDVVVLDMEIQARHPDLLKKMRQWNPDIVLLVYLTPQEIKRNADHSFSQMRRKLAGGISDNWYLRDSGGDRLSWWPGTWLLNVTSDAPQSGGQRFNDYIVDFTVNELLASGYWDGVFYDNAWDNITYFAGERIDLNGDGRNDSNLDGAWRDGMTYIYDRTRLLTDNEYIIVGNNTTLHYTDELNGMMFENFTQYDWEDMMRRYKAYDEKNSQRPNISIINANTNNGGHSKDDYQRVRYALTSALLQDGYFAYDYGDTNHAQLWRYDEYDIDLGDPIAEPAPQNGAKEYERDVWRRDFSRGVSLVNSSNQEQMVALGGEFEKIHGTQDRQVNDGSIISEVELESKDGLVLLKTFDTLEQIIFTNGAFMRFFRPDGSRVRNGFFIFEEGQKGGDKLAHIDLDGNGKKELVEVRNSRVMVWRDDGQLYMKEYPYGASYTGDIRMAITDTNGDGLKEIVVAPSDGYPAPIKMYTRHGRQMRNDWYPYGEQYSGGYHLGAADVRNRGKDMLVVGAGQGVEPIVSLHDYHLDEIYRWHAFERSFRGGVHVTGGDVDGDDYDEVIVGAGPGKKPVIKVFNESGELQQEPFTAYSAFNTPGIDVRAVDVDFDGKDDIIGMSTGIGL